MSIQSNSDKEMIVLARYKVLKKGKYEPEITVRFDLIVKRVDQALYSLIRFFKKYFTKSIEIEKPEQVYTKILSITENGVEKLEAMPRNIVLFLSSEDKDA